ncbi:MAG: lysine--tRNA ligase [Patescibacteria group bacterium]
MSTFEEIKEERIKKASILKKKGINPYPVSSHHKDFGVAKITAGFAKLSKKKEPLFIVGRVMAMRSHGGSVFFDINDGSASIQAYIKKDEVGEGQFSLFFATLDVGDFIEVSGHLFLTKKKEKTIKVSEWKMLAKSLRPLPEKWHGLQDIEERFRKRYLDILMNDEVRQRFLLRSKIISEIRKFLNGQEFLEVETPILQTLAGGALAEPFKTHHNALDVDLYLRVAPELYLKKLLVGSFTKVYEMGRNFRNEGIDATHNPEFTMLELYEAYRDSNYLKGFTEKFLKNLVKSIFSKNEVKCGGNKISFSKKFVEISYFDAFKRFILMSDVESATKDDFALKAKQLGVKVEDFESKEKIMDNIFKKIRPKIIQPTFITDYPTEFSPLAKRKEDNYKLIDRFQLIINGMEIVNGFSELNDPFDQRERFKEQDKARARGEKDVSPSDEDYLEAMEYGMPPAAGLGMGIDRLIMLFADVPNIKEVILFPTLRPER